MENNLQSHRHFYLMFGLGFLLPCGGVIFAYGCIWREMRLVKNLDALGTRSTGNCSYNFPGWESVPLGNYFQNGQVKYKVREVNDPRLSSLVETVLITAEWRKGMSVQQQRGGAGKRWERQQSRLLRTSICVLVTYVGAWLPFTAVSSYIHFSQMDKISSNIAGILEVVQ